jgi:hypothetical protein
MGVVVPDEATPNGRQISDDYGDENETRRRPYAGTRPLREAS